jgi:transposase InsO family protein
MLNNFTRECLALETDTSFASQRVTRILDGVTEQRGCPMALRMDNGPELTSRHFLAWCMEWKWMSAFLIHREAGKTIRKLNGDGPSPKLTITSHGDVAKPEIAWAWVSSL